MGAQIMHEECRTEPERVDSLPLFDVPGLAMAGALPS